ncbi:relaxase/mobilization nuclease domain-containing protein [Streptococcus alactolyticus]|uniref:relaxase/mobilization nuclease domain-containing protein n=1 Tax=Streptococcus alactolyticus TaxID=29389 RepID=UPI003F95CE11
MPEKGKTEEKLVSGLHCEPETVKEEMQATKELWGKTDGRTYKHYVQSYHEDEEITPEQAHKNAVELAEHTKAWKGHEVLIHVFIIAMSCLLIFNINHFLISHELIYSDF